MISERERKSLSSRKFNNNNIEILREFLQNGNLPDWSEESKAKYRENYKSFIIGDRNAIIYQPLHLEVIEDDNKENILNELYNDKDTGLGAGITSFYNLVRSRYLNFSRQNIVDFLQKQTAYQLTKREVKPVNRPIVAKYPNNRWAVDLIDMKN